MFQHECADGLYIVPPNGINELAGKREPGPAWSFIAARQNKLGVGEFGGAGFDRPVKGLLNSAIAGRIALAKLTEQVLGLVFELIEVRANGKTAIGHDKPP